MSTEVTKAEEPSGLLQVIGKIAQDPSIDLERFERLIQLQRQMEERQAEKAFTLAMSLLQPELPAVERNGTIVIRDKNDPNKIIQQTPFATWEDINDAIRGPLAKHGFTLTFKVDRKDDRVLVLSTLKHLDGHKEETELSLPLDTSGSKQNIQAFGSSISYGKRYGASALLNITSRAKGDADDDGQAASAAPTVTDQQIGSIRHLLELNGGNEAKFLRFIKVRAIEDILASKFDDVCNVIRTNGGRKKVEPT